MTPTVVPPEASGTPRTDPNVAVGRSGERSPNAS